MPIRPAPRCPHKPCSKRETWTSSGEQGSVQYRSLGAGAAVGRWSRQGQGLKSGKIAAPSITCFQTRIVRAPRRLEFEDSTIRVQYWEGSTGGRLGHAPKRAPEIGSPAQPKVTGASELEPFFGGRSSDHTAPFLQPSVCGSTVASSEPPSGSRVRAKHSTVFSLHSGRRPSLARRTSQTRQDGR
jgi:hypothetical protein